MNFKKICLPFFVAVNILMACNSEAQKTNLSVTDFEKAITEQQIQLLDVRTAGEYENGHIKNSLQADWTNETQFKQRVQALNKNVPVYTYCLSGARSGAATQWLNANGYTAYNMDGGFKSWNSAGKPIEQKIKSPQITMAQYHQQIPLDKTVLVDFGAVWCPPCKKMDVVLKDLQDTHGTKFLLLRIDGGMQTDLIKEIKIEEFPTFIMYKNGKPVWRKQGLVQKEEFIEQL